MDARGGGGAVIVPDYVTNLRNPVTGALVNCWSNVSLSLFLSLSHFLSLHIYLSCNTSSLNIIVKRLN